MVTVVGRAKNSLNIENRIVWKRQILVNFVKQMILKDRTANVTLVFKKNESNASEMMRWT